MDAYRHSIVMPVYVDSDRRLQFLCAAIDSLAAQTESAFLLVLVDDASPIRFDEAPTFVESTRSLQNKPTTIRLRRNYGQWMARNVGLGHDSVSSSEAVSFLDSDDVADPQRVSVEADLFASMPDVDMSYHRFAVIDEFDAAVSTDRLTPSIREILDALAHPPDGRDAWIRVGVETGYVSLTSTVAVRTSVARRFPFPPERVSEDLHCWFRYMANGGFTVFLDDLVAGYRIPQDLAGASSVRVREGSGYYAEKARVDLDGFRAAAGLALAAGRLPEPEYLEVVARFLVRLVITLVREGERTAASRMAALAASYSQGAALSHAASLGEQAIVENLLSGEVEGHA